MKRRTVVLFVALLSLFGAALVPALPAGASHSRDIDPTKLVLPASALPAGAQVVHSALSDNADADGAPSPDKYNDDLTKLHQTRYTKLGRVTGYRERFKFSVGGADVTTQSMISIFGTADQAKAALLDATTGFAPVALIGAPLSPACAAGDTCAAASGTNPGTTDRIIYTAFVRGNSLVELASAVGDDKWSTAGPSIVSALYATLAAADSLVQAVLGGSGTISTPTPTPTPVPSGAPITVPARKLGAFYLALGDSYAAGYLTSDRPIDTPCTAPDAPGFVCIFWRYLKRINSQLQLNNLAEPGSDSCELAGAGHRCNDPTSRQSPVDAGVQFLKAHPGQVSPITLTIGGNDLLGLVDMAIKDPAGTLSLLPAVFPRFRSNLDSILARLRAAAPSATIIVTTQPNPFGGFDPAKAPPGLVQLSAAALGQLNQIMKDEAPKYGTIIADTAAAFDAALGGANTLTWVPVYISQGRIEIHPTPQGYKVYGDALIKASGYLAPVTVSVHLTKKQVKAGKSDTVAGTATLGASLSVKVWTPRHKPITLSAAIAVDGTFTRAFRVGKIAGKGDVQVCAVDGNSQKACSSKLAFTVH